MTVGLGDRLEQTPSPTCYLFEGPAFMATKDLSADLLKTPISLLGIPGQITPGTWGSQSTDDVSSYGERLEDIGCDEETIAQINSAAAALLDFRDLVAPDGVSFDDSALLRFGTDKNGGLTTVSGPVVKAKENEVVLVMGNTALTITEDGGEYKLGSLVGSLQVTEGKGYTNFRIQFQDPESGDRFRVKAYVREGVTEDDILDGIAEGKSLAEFLAEAGSGKGMSANMADLEIGDYRVLGTTRRAGKDGKPDWYTIKLEGYDQEVKSRSATDVALKAGFDVDKAHEKGKVCILSITSKTPFGDKGYFQIGCSLVALDPDKAEARLKATTDRLKLEKAVEATSAKRPAPEPVKASAAAAAPAAAESKGAELAAKAAAARKKPAAAAVGADEGAQAEVSIDF